MKRKWILLLLETYMKSKRGIKVVLNVVERDGISILDKGRIQTSIIKWIRIKRINHSHKDYISIHN